MSAGPMSAFWSGDGLCRAHGDDFSSPTSLMSLASSAPAGLGRPFFLFAILLALATLGALVLWCCHNRRWCSLGIVATLLAFGLDQLMFMDRGSVWQTLAGACILFAPLCLLLFVCLESGLRASRAIGGNGDIETASLPLHAWLVLAGLVVPLHLLFFLVVNVIDVFSMQMLSGAGAIVNCLFSLTRPVQLQTLRDPLHMLLAAWPTWTVGMALHAWFCRRRLQHTQRTAPRHDGLIRRRRA